LDLDDDGRAVGAVDWDRDGDLDFWITNRNSPQLRLLRNDVPSNHHYLALRLQGKTCNRDAIGARVELILSAGDVNRRIQTLRAGDAYLAQSSKWIHFGLGKSTEIEGLVVHWPGGKAETFTGATVDGRYRIAEGTGRAEPLDIAPPTEPLGSSTLNVPASSSQAQVVLASPIPLPRLRFTAFQGDSREVPRTGKRPQLLNLWASWCPPCMTELDQFARQAHELGAVVDVVALSVDGLSAEQGSEGAARDVLARLKFPFRSGLATPDLVEKLQLIDHHIFDVHLPLPLPTSVLVSRDGELSAIYKGPVSVARVLEDVKKLDALPEARRGFSVPYPGRWCDKPMRARLLPLVWDLIEHGYLDDGLEYLSNSGPWLSRDPEYAKLLARSGYELLERGDAHGAAEQYRAAIRVSPTTTVAHLNLALALMRQGQYAEALAQYHEALRHTPNDSRLHYSLAWLLATAPDPSVRDGAEAVRWAQQAAQSTGFRQWPALEALAAAYAEAGRFEEAVASAREALTLARTTKKGDIMQRIESRLQLYESRRPYHESQQGPSLDGKN
jgi:thiol-disulfide isomerase/thioredoxin